VGLGLALEKATEWVLGVDILHWAAATPAFESNLQALMRCVCGLQIRVLGVTGGLSEA
jgi:hypothetical protein